MWKLDSSGKGASLKTEAVRIKGSLTTNDGEIAVKWALEGHGILMRAEWDIRQYLDDGQLVAVLPDYDTPNADIFAVYSQRHQMSNRISCVRRFRRARELGELRRRLLNFL